MKRSLEEMLRKAKTGIVTATGVACLAAAFGFADWHDRHTYVHLNINGTNVAFNRTDPSELIIMGTLFGPKRFYDTNHDGKLDHEQYYVFGNRRLNIMYATPAIAPEVFAQANELYRHRPVLK